MNPIRKFQMTFPYAGKIIETTSLKQAVRECYHEFKQTNGIPEGIFTVTDLDQEIEYKFKKRRKHKIEQLGGNPNNISKEPVKDSNSNQETLEKLILKINQLEAKVDRVLAFQNIAKMNASTRTKTKTKQSITPAIKYPTING